MATHSESGLADVVRPGARNYRISEDQELDANGIKLAKTRNEHGRNESSNRPAYRTWTLRLLLGADAHLGPCMGAGGGWPPPFVSNAATAAVPCAMHPISSRIMVKRNS
jgi:hypothetical protein